MSGHNSEQVWELVDRHGEEFIGLADRIWEMPELGYQEHRSAGEHAAMLAAQGFRVTTGIAGIPTAVVGEAGEEGPVIAILGEFDALPGLSQEAGVATKQPRPGEAAGHACGHNLLGSAAMLAATAVKDWLAAQGIKGRVRYYGCPAEESGAGKLFMVREGAFKDVDIALSWHPAPFCAVNPAMSLALVSYDFSFTGRASHAAAAPHLGRSALDAVELMNVGVNYMREHMPSDARIHYATIDAGGIAPNVVQSKAVVRYIVRARELPELNGLVARVQKIAQGAALMTETSVEWRAISGMSNLLGNAPLEQAMYDNLVHLGPPQWDDADRKLAGEIRATLRPDDIVGAHLRFGLAPDMDTPLCERIVPLGSNGGGKGIGSTDVGDVSWVVPTAQIRGATYAIGTPGHSWQLTAQGKSGIAHKGMVHAAKVMAATAVDAIRDPALLARARAEHAARIAATPYVCPLPDDVKPALGMALGA
ncbi:MAG: amidohydrolase [Acetobacteraceae bacterium]|nr:amidohydrolase [Acetobacteraceae bacterium]